MKHQFLCLHTKTETSSNNCIRVALNETLVSLFTYKDGNIIQQLHSCCTQWNICFHFTHRQKQKYQERSQVSYITLKIHTLNLHNTVCSWDICTLSRCDCLVVLCFDLIMQSSSVGSCDLFISFLWGCFTGLGPLCDYPIAHVSNMVKDMENHSTSIVWILLG